MFDKSFFNNVLSVVAARLMSDEGRVQDSVPEASAKVADNASTEYLSRQYGADTESRRVVIGGVAYYLPPDRMARVMEELRQEIGRWVQEQSGRMSAADYSNLIRAYDEWRESEEVL